MYDFAIADVSVTGSDSEGLDQLEKMRAELMAKLEGDFKLSPEEESDSDGEPFLTIHLAELIYMNHGIKFYGMIACQRVVGTENFYISRHQYYQFYHQVRIYNLDKSYYSAGKYRFYATFWCSV